MKVRYKKKDATRPLVFSVTSENVEDAVCSDPSHCVLALALKDCFGDLFEDVQVGITCTKLYRGDGTVVRYRTPLALREALKTFDRSGKWLMPEGEYRLLPVAPSYRMGNPKRNRLDKMPADAKGKKKPRKKKTRTVKRVDAAIPTEKTK